MNRNDKIVILLMFSVLSQNIDIPKWYSICLGITFMLWFMLSFLEDKYK